MLEQLLQLLDCETRVDTDQRRCAIATTTVGAVAARALRLVNGDPSPRFTTRRGCGMRFPHCGDPRHVTRVDIERGGFGIDRRPAPLASTVEARQYDCARFARRCEQRAVAQPAEPPALGTAHLRLH